MAVVTAADIEDVIGRYKLDIQNQVNFNNELLASGAVKEKVRRAAGQVSLKTRGHGSIQFVDDDLTISIGDSVAPVVARYLPAALFGRLRIGRKAAKTAMNPDEGADLITSEVEHFTESFGNHENRALVTSVIASSVTMTAAASTFSISAGDISGVRAGMSLDVYTSGGSFVETVQVGSVDNPDVGSAATVTLIGSTTIQNTTATATLRIRGSADDGIVSFTDAASTTGSLYGKAATIWAGNQTTMAAYSNPALRRFTSKIKRVRGKRPEHAMCNSFTMDTVYENSQDKIRYSAKDPAYDDYGPEIRVAGLKWFENDSVPDGEIFLWCGSDVELHVWQKLEPETGRGGMVHAMETAYSYDIQFDKIEQLRFNRRNGVGRVSGISLT